MGEGGPKSYQFLCTPRNDSNNNNRWQSKVLIEAQWGEELTADVGDWQTDFTGRCCPLIGYTFTITTTKTTTTTTTTTITTTSSITTMRVWVGSTNLVP